MQLAVFTWLHCIALLIEWFQNSMFLFLSSILKYRKVWLSIWKSWKIKDWVMGQSILESGHVPIIEKSLTKNRVYIITNRHVKREMYWYIRNQCRDYWWLWNGIAPGQSCIKGRFMGKVEVSAKGFLFKLSRWNMLKFWTMQQRTFCIFHLDKCDYISYFMNNICLQ